MKTHDIEVAKSSSRTLPETGDPANLDERLDVNEDEHAGTYGPPRPADYEDRAGIMP